MLLFVGCTCQLYRKIRGSCLLRKSYLSIQGEPRLLFGTYTRLRKYSYFLSRKTLKDRLAEERCIGKRRDYNKSFHAVANSDSLKTNWCFYVSIVLFAVACLFPGACAYVEYSSGSESSLQVLFEKYISHYGIIGLQLVFSTVHSGLAALRPFATKLVGERLYRIGFAASSLPLAVILIEYFVSHRYDGLIIWQVRTFPGIHEMIWLLSFVSFYLLYPGTFRLLEIAAIQKPKLHLFREGVIRITRHPQLWGQILWCLGHTLWLGSSFSVVTSLCLVSYHLFGAWHGDRRLEMKYGEEWRKVEEQTNILPFVAVFSGKQKMDISEFFNPAYLVVTIFTLCLYYLHPNILQLFGHSS